MTPLRATQSRLPFGYNFPERDFEGAWNVRGFRGPKPTLVTWHKPIYLYEMSR
jgi:hypothetical protein